MGTGDWGLGIGDKVDKAEFISQLITHYSLLITQHSAPAKRRATANSTQHSALSSYAP
ncbi:hypothetical protein [Nostoc sp. CMAA1605]|uniref:hypothetical protein n=1 Tax=Nostoc sp. CMAA1605 TaxID=2055159 RepID=UPI001F3B40E2|nr:hypothetical protein [Nostoc sp. CMAA1605]